MARKRARRSSDPKTTSKHFKHSQGKNLLDLPREIIDLILDHTIDLPNKPCHAEKAKTTISRALMAPIAQTSTASRQCSFDLIWKKCFWIKVEINTTKLLSRFKEYAELMPYLPTMFWSQCQAATSFFELEIGDREVQQQYIRQTRLLTSKTKTFIFPYNFDSFNRVCEYIAEQEAMGKEIMGRGTGALIVRYKPYTREFEHLLNSRIIPSLTTFWNLQSVDFNVPDACKPPSLSVIKMTDETIRASDLLRAATTAIELANRYEAEGRSEEAGLKLLYTQWIRFKAEMFLPGPLDWMEGEREDDPDIMDVPYNHTPPTRNAVGNKLRQLLHEIEYRSCMAFRDLYERYGTQWLFTHYKVFGADEGRWLMEPSFTWFGLSTSELAQLHHARAVAQRIQKAYADLYESITLSYVWPSWALGMNRLRYHPDHNHVAIDDMYFARWLQDDNKEFHRFYEEMLPDCASEIRKIETLLADRCYAASTWRGDCDMLDDWGGTQVLQYLPLARKGLEVIDKTNTS